MKKRNKVFLGLFVGIILVFAYYIYINTGYIDRYISDFIFNYGLISVLVLGFLADVLEQPIGPEVPASIAIVYGLGALPVFLFTILGSAVGGLTSFYFGRKFLSKKINESCNVGKFNKYCKFFGKYGKLSLVIAAMTPIPYVSMVWISGAFFMRVRHFLIFGIIPRIIRIGIVLFVIGRIF